MPWLRGGVEMGPGGGQRCQTGAQTCRPRTATARQSVCGLVAGVTALSFDDETVTLEHDLWRWLWWEPDDVPRGGDPLAAKRTRVRWEDISVLDATGPYGELIIRYHTNGHFHSLQARPSPSLAPDWPEQATALMLFAAGQGSATARPGWTAAEELSWQTITHWPDEVNDVVYSSPYRSAAPVDPVRAIRETPSPYEALLLWLASSPERPWGETPRRVVVSEEHVCVETFDRQKVRVRRDAIRGRRRTASGDRAYYYGRGLRLVLALRDRPCPVVWALDADYRGYVEPE